MWVLDKLNEIVEAVIGPQMNENEAAEYTQSVKLVKESGLDNIFSEGLGGETRELFFEGFHAFMINEAAKGLDSTKIADSIQVIGNYTEAVYVKDNVTQANLMLKAFDAYAAFEGPHEEKLQSVLDILNNRFRDMGYSVADVVTTVDGVRNWKPSDSTPKDYGAMHPIPGMQNG